MKQMDRRLLILMRLREETPVRANDLAEQCECSVRTVYRDIDALCDAGVPIAAMPGEGYRLVPGYHLPPIAFTPDEAIQLLLGADMTLGLGTDEQREAARAAAAKVEAALTPETRREVERMRKRIRVSTGMRTGPSPWMRLLQQAVANDQVVQLRYHSYSPDRVTERKVEPYQLIFYADDWHLVGYCRLREGMRDFRASRIRDAVLLPEHFERTPDSEAEADHDHNPRRTTEIRVFIDAPTLPWARENPPFGFVREEQAEGGAVFHIEAWEIRRLMPWLLSWGAAARVLSPPEVARAVRDEAHRLVSAYAEA